MRIQVIEGKATGTVDSSLGQWTITTGHLLVDGVEVAAVEAANLASSGGWNMGGLMSFHNLIGWPDLRSLAIASGCREAYATVKDLHILGNAIRKIGWSPIS